MSDEESILGGALGLDAASGGSLPIALGLIAALLIAVVVSVLVQEEEVTMTNLDLVMKIQQVDKWKCMFNK